MKDPLSLHKEIKLAADYRAIGTVEECKEAMEYMKSHQRKVVPMRKDKDRIDKFLEVMSVNGMPIVSAEMLDWLIGQGFFVKPASINHHGNYTGGLFDHSLEVTKTLVEMTQRFYIPWKDARSPLVVGMFHDLCKVDDYVDEYAKGAVMMGTGSPVTNSPEWVYNPDWILKGHGDKSIILLSQFMTLTEEEVMCIRFHMGAYETDNWDSYDKAIRKYESVLWTHTADMYASKVKGV